LLLAADRHITNHRLLLPPYTSHPHPKNVRDSNFQSHTPREALFRHVAGIFHPWLTGSYRTNNTTGSVLDEKQLTAFYPFFQIPVVQPIGSYRTSDGYMHLFSSVRFFYLTMLSG